MSKQSMLIRYHEYLGVSDDEETVLEENSENIEEVAEVLTEESN